MKKVSPQSDLLAISRTSLMFALGAFLAGGALAYSILTWRDLNPITQTSAVRESDLSLTKSDYSFIDPLIGSKGVQDPPKDTPMRDEVSAAIAKAKGIGLISASVDFRDIKDSSWFSINGTELYTPASLNKVPVMIAYFKIAETEPAYLAQELTYTGTTDTSAVQEIRSQIQLVSGASYTAAELIERMIRYSDNNAADLLVAHLKDTGRYTDYERVFSDLGIDPAVLERYTDNMNVRDYSRFLRVLFNATYLSRDDSERALKLLSETDFAAGIEAGVPNNVSVAQKFGEVRMVDGNGTLVGKELNDCGIIYYPGHPYLLCVMTKGLGDDIPGLEGTISNISHIVYRQMQQLYP